MLALTFQIGQDRLALDVRHITEVVPRVRLSQPAGGPAWLAGLFVYRSQVVPVIDLHRLTGAGPCPPHLSSRIIIVPHRWQGAERLVGLLAAGVAEIREIEPAEQSPTRLTAPGQPDLGPVFVDGGGLLRLLDLDRLVPDAGRAELVLASEGRRP
jgi:chemotaxis-related protein WspB